MAEVNPAGETGQASNKRKAKKLEGDGAKKRPNLKLDLSKIKKGMIHTTLDRWLIKPRTPTRVRFNELVTLKKNHTAYGKLDSYTPERDLRSRK